MPHRNALIERGLFRAAEQLGDITAPVMDLLLQRFPATTDCFHEKAAGTKAERLQGEMVEQVLYCLMAWHETPAVIEIIIVDTVPHHLDTLNIPLELFAGLIDAVVETISALIPEEAHDERAAWQDLHVAMNGLVRDGLRHSVKYRSPQPVR